MPIAKNFKCYQKRLQRMMTQKQNVCTGTVNYDKRCTALQFLLYNQYMMSEKTSYVTLKLQASISELDLAKQSLESQHAYSHCQSLTGNSQHPRL